jgi:hypothetical protein
MFGIEDEYREKINKLNERIRFLEEELMYLNNTQHYYESESKKWWKNYDELKKQIEFSGKIDE